jgi:hypothetical protein
LLAARPATIRAVAEVLEHAPAGNWPLIDPEVELLAAAVELLRAGPLDDATVALFDRMLRHANPHVKWKLLEDAPADPRLMPAMFHVLAEDWGWQAAEARTWLAAFEQVEGFEAARAAAGATWVADADESDDDDEDDDDEEEDDDDDGDDVN